MSSLPFGPRNSDTKAFLLSNSLSPLLAAPSLFLACGPLAEANFSFWTDWTDYVVQPGVCFHWVKHVCSRDYFGKGISAYLFLSRISQTLIQISAQGFPSFLISVCEDTSHLRLYYNDVFKWFLPLWSKTRSSIWTSFRWSLTHARLCFWHSDMRRTPPEGFREFFHFELTIVTHIFKHFSHFRSLCRRDRDSDLSFSVKTSSSNILSKPYLTSSRPIRERSLP